MNEQGSALVRSTGSKTSLGLSNGASRLLNHDQNSLRQLAATGDAADQGGFFGSFAGVDINDIALITTVPEPTAGVLCLGGVCALLRRRRSITL